MGEPAILQECSDLTPERMTEWLRDAGRLETGSVASVSCNTEAINQGFVSNVARVALTHSFDARGDLPTSVFLKLSKPGVHSELLRAGAHEVAFYRAMAAIGGDVPIPTIYSAEADGDGRTHIVMQDLTDTHVQRPLPIPPSDEHCRQLVTALAKLHASWWNSPRLGTTLGKRYTREEADATHQRLRASFPKFCDFLGDALLPRQRAAYERILASNFLDRLTERLISQHNVSLVHGDMHTGNIMLPKDGDGQVTLVDWHLWSIDLAALDLAFLMALHWSPARRAALEIPLLRLYHQTLMEHGVGDYSWEQLWGDYRSEVIITMLIPIGQHRRGSPAGVIWHGLQDSWAAVEELDCLALL